MRTYTIVFSIVAHTLVVLAVVVSTVAATDTLPEPRRATEFIIVKAAVPSPPPSPRRAERQTATQTSRDAAPIEAQAGVLPESVFEPIADVPAPDAAIGAGLGPPTSGVEPPPPAARIDPPTPLRVGGDIQPPVKTYHVAPVYPLVAQAAHITGVVILDALIAEDGSMREVKVLRGNPLLAQAAADAVRQWQFTPTLLNGRPVPVVMTVTVVFGLH